MKNEVGFLINPTNGYIINWLTVSCGGSNPRVSMFSFLIPIFGIVLGYIFLNELITPKIMVSVVLVLIGIYLAKRSND